MRSTPGSQTVSHSDNTITASLAAPPRRFDRYALLSLHMPWGQIPAAVAGRYLLARCGAQSAEERWEQWHIYFRRPLFVTAARLHHAPRPAPKADDPDDSDDQGPMAIYELLLPLNADPPDPGYAWLARLNADDPLNVIGLLGNGFHVEENTRNLLLTAAADRLATLQPLVDPVLDRGGRVTVLVRAERPPIELIARLPVAVEVHTVADAAEWTAALQELLPWADQVCAALPRDACTRLTEQVRSKRFRLEPGFAQVLLEAPLYCGIGACLACVVPLGSGGVTRACVHGPVFDLSQL